MAFTRNPGPNSSMIFLQKISVKDLITSRIGTDEKPPWRSLYVYECLQENLIERAKFWEDALKTFNHIPGDPRLPNSPWAYLTKVNEILEIGRTGQIIHLRRMPLKELYQTPPHPEQPFVETVRLPFSKMFLEFSEPLEVEAGPDYGTDMLVGLMVREVEAGKIRLFCIWQDCEFTELFIDTSLLPDYPQMPCDLESKPPTAEPCWREIAISNDPKAEYLPFCPATMDSRVSFPCAHRWRDKIVGNVFINIINLLNATNLVFERIETPKKRIKRAQKEGRHLPSEYRKIDLEWFTPIKRQEKSQRESGRGNERTVPFLRRGHFRQYAPGKFTWVTAHICRADLLEKHQDIQRVYKA